MKKTFRECTAVNVFLDVFQKQKQFQLKAGLALFVLIFSSTVLASGTSYNETTVLPFSPDTTVLQGCTGAGQYLAPDGTCKNIVDHGLWLRGIDSTTGGIDNVNFMGGKVGIGLFSDATYQQVPEARLDIGGAIKLRNMNALVGGNAGAPSDLVNRLYAMNGTLMWGAEAITTQLGGSSSNSIEEGDTSVGVADGGSDGTITMKTDGAMAMTIDNAGKVGIGKAIPAVKLDVLGELSVSHQATSADPNYSISTYWGDASSLTGGLRMRNGGSSANTGIKLTQTAGSGDSSIITVLNADLASTDTYFTTTNDSGTEAEKMRITGDGKVGIGIPVPTKALHVKGGAKFENTSSSDAVEIGDARIYWDTVNKELVILVNTPAL